MVGHLHGLIINLCGKSRSLRLSDWPRILRNPPGNGERLCGWAFQVARHASAPSGGTGLGRDSMASKNPDGSGSSAMLTFVMWYIPFSAEN